MICLNKMESEIMGFDWMKPEFLPFYSRLQIKKNIEKTLDVVFRIEKVTYYKRSFQTKKFHYIEKLSFQF